MGFNAAATIIPGKGTVLVADPDTAPPEDYLTLNPADATALVTAAPGWDVLGHTSRENTVGMSKEGGEATQSGSWWDEALSSNYAATNWSVTVNSLQVDALTLGLAFGGGDLDTTEGSYAVNDIRPTAKSLYILIVGGNSRMGIYIPNTTVSIGDAPELAIDAFFEIALSAAILNSPTSGNRFKFFHPALKSA